MTQLSFSDVGVDFGATHLFSGVTFTVAQGERWGVVGRNGTGKTTLFRLLTGELQPTRGVIARRPGLRASLLEQHRDFGGATTVWEAAAGELAELLALERSLAEQAAALAEDASEEAMARYGRDLERFEREGADLRTSVEVPLYTALLGGEVTVPSLDGQLALRIPPETQNGRVFRLRGQGLRRPGTSGARGDLLARVSVQLPTNLSERERQLFAQLREAREARTAHAGRAGGAS